MQHNNLSCKNQIKTRKLNIVKLDLWSPIERIKKYEGSNHGEEKSKQ